MNNDISELSKALRQEDLVGRVIRVQIHVEQLVNEYLEAALAKPKHLEAMQLDFFNKVQLALALGMPEDFKKPLNFLGNTRNKFAYKLDFSFDKGMMNNFYSAFSEEHKKVITENSSLSSLSWVAEGKSWKAAEPDEKFMIFSLAIYYLLKMAVYETVQSKKVAQLKNEVYELSKHL